MAQEMSESRKQFIDFMLDVRKQSELVEAKERINEKVEGLQKELREIADRAYQTAIGEKVGEYQEKANAEGLTPDELENVAAWVNGFKAGCERNDRQAKSEAKKPCRRFFLIRNVGRQRRTCQA